nr:aminotransferase class V-fold PLP-dependent enzyme [Desulfobacteraceae bacterium]
NCGSINLAWMEEGVTPDDAGDILNSEYDIFVRVGLHCAPLAHQTLGTFPDGTVRFSMGCFNSIDEMEITARAIRNIVER